jgi:hypothetical protein
METPLAPSPPLPPDLVDSAGTLLQDVKCRRCGYNLRGLNHAGRCPECGTPAGLSCHGDLLRFADPAWVEKLARGARLIVWGVLISIIVSIAGVLLVTVSGMSALAPVVAILGSIVGLYGAWLLTEPDPSGIGEDRYVTDRKIVRFALAVGLASQVLQFGQRASVAIPSLFVLVAALAGLAGLVGIVGEFAKLTYLRKLALRIPEPELARRAGGLRWAMAITLGVMIVFGAVTGALALMLRSAGPGGAPPNLTGRGGAVQSGIMATGCVMGIAGIAYLIVALLVLALVSRLGKAFQAQAETARTTWAAAQPAAEVL